MLEAERKEMCRVWRFLHAQIPGGPIRLLKVPPPPPAPIALVPRPPGVATPP